ncbi:hypothetical protein [Haliangium ochraceum]|uniref:Uncharacterized protein n=1 Tax=Haliangium ochraceum (strain DSM 14365 / JCM 11303 / SMP-2) TaxID=502025 RepID=D0LKW1_HALO1|nr:hypothetical protein [Haliangium ochraceum]ACY16681.1 conserved hypothetical protein [Haliangium ochraceum DSM 14365]
MKRTLHLVRRPGPAAVPQAALAPGDLVVYLALPDPQPESPPQAATALWPAADAPPPPRNAHVHVQVLDAPALCALFFEYDAVVVW